MKKVKVTKRNPKYRQRSNPSLGPLAIVAGGLILLAVAAYALWGNGAARPGANFKPEVTGAPKIKVDRDKVDLGDVKLGQTVDVSFEITNLGDQPLRLAEAPYVEVVEGC